MTYEPWLLGSLRPTVGELRQTARREKAECSAIALHHHHQQLATRSRQLLGSLPAPSGYLWFGPDPSQAAAANNNSTKRLGSVCA